MTLSLDLKTYTKKDIDRTSQHFLNKQIIAYPADTIYGLGGLATEASIVKRIIKAKQRPDNKSFIILVKSYCMLKKYCYVSTKQDKYIRDYWQLGKKPTTFIFRARPTLPKELINTDGSVAVRMPINSQFLIDLIKKINFPIISTSLNLSGKSVITDPKKIPSKLAIQINLIINTGKLKSTASKIIDIRDMTNIKKIR